MKYWIIVICMVIASGVLESSGNKCGPKEIYLKKGDKRNLMFWTNDGRSSGSSTSSNTQLSHSPEFSTSPTKPIYFSSESGNQNDWFTKKENNTFLIVSTTPLTSFQPIETSTHEMTTPKYDNENTDVVSTEQTSLDIKEIISSTTTETEKTFNDATDSTSILSTTTKELKYGDSTYLENREENENFEKETSTFESTTAIELFESQTTYLENREENENFEKETSTFKSTTAKDLSESQTTYLENKEENENFEKETSTFMSTTAKELSHTTYLTMKEENDIEEQETSTAMMTILKDTQEPYKYNNNNTENTEDIYAYKEETSTTLSTTYRQSNGEKTSYLEMRENNQNESSTPWINSPEKKSESQDKNLEMREENDAYEKETSTSPMMTTSKESVVLQDKYLTNKEDSETTTKATIVSWITTSREGSEGEINNLEMREDNDIRQQGTNVSKESKNEESSTIKMKEESLATEKETSTPMSTTITDYKDSDSNKLEMREDKETTVTETLSVWSTTPKEMQDSQTINLEMREEDEITQNETTTAWSHTFQDDAESNTLHPNDDNEATELSSDIQESQTSEMSSSSFTSESKPSFEDYESQNEITTPKEPYETTNHSTMNLTMTSLMDLLNYISSENQRNESSFSSQKTKNTGAQSVVIDIQQSSFVNGPLNLSSVQIYERLKAEVIKKLGRDESDQVAFVTKLFDKLLAKQGNETKVFSENSTLFQNIMKLVHESSELEHLEKRLHLPGEFLRRSVTSQLIESEYLPSSRVQNQDVVSIPLSPLVVNKGNLTTSEFRKFINSQSDQFKRAFLQENRKERSVFLPESTNCDWNLRTENELYLLVTFHNLSAPFTIDCKGAYIEVERENNGFEARWCGNKITENGSDPHVIFAKAQVRISVFDDGETSKDFVTGYSANVEVVDLFEGVEYSELKKSNQVSNVSKMLFGGKSSKQSEY